MADHTQTVTNSFKVLGMSIGTKWDAAVWDTDLWGVDEDLATAVGKFLDSENITITQTMGKDFVRAAINNAITIAEDIESIEKTIGLWNYIFSKPTIDGDSKLFDQFSKIADGTDAFSAVSDPSTDWDEV